MSPAKMYVKLYTISAVLMWKTKAQKEKFYGGWILIQLNYGIAINAAIKVIFTFRADRVLNSNLLLF